MTNQPHWSYWGNGMPADLAHITEDMAKASRERRAEVMAKCPPGQYADVGESSHYNERSERAGIAAAIASAPIATFTCPTCNGAGREVSAWDPEIIDRCSTCNGARKVLAFIVGPQGTQ
jgi:hypothetical protein